MKGGKADKLTLPQIAKKHKLPIEKIFTKTLIHKFKWAFDVDEKWIF